MIARPDPISPIIEKEKSEYQSMKERHKDHRTIASTPTPNKRGLFSLIVCAGPGEASRYTSFLPVIIEVEG